ncbi:DUF5333 domain-containing protein [Vannielia litorea]|uniref:DUF5333 domain-containing protein n=1 Tax=Vannielia litorea TaxID=1217970 RepID=UPI001C95CBE5|nr:DUF5333 domain-containing protein [Vannielia litorea]MBY6047602.1 DUF5333 domain-containing protein [Vannielia litorea]MBY6075016.1 DUF5333 domain-containing protein [Vannielia litorea]
MTNAGRALAGAVIAVILALGFSGAASAKSLADSKAVNSGLISVGIALEISEKCPDISARTIRGYSFLNSLKKQARAEGFSDAEIDAYVDDKAQKARLIKKARAYMASKGANGSTESYCKVGRAEIAAGTQAGNLMRAR